MKIFSGKSKNLYMSLILTYTTLIIVSLIVIGLSFLRATSSHETLIRKYNSLIMNQLENTFESSTNETTLITQQFSDNERILSLAQCKDIESEASQDVIMSVMETLRSCQSNSDFVENIFIYFKNSDSVITRRTIVDSNVYFNKYCNFKDYDYEEWKSEYLTSYNYMKYFPSTAMETVPADTEVIPFVTTIAAANDNEALINVVILSRTEQLIGAISDLEYVNNGRFYITNEKGNIIVSTRDNPEKDSEYISMAINSPEPDFEATRDDVTVLASKITPNYWTYICVLPRVSSIKELNSVKIWTAFLIIIYLVSMVIFITFSIKKQYSPIRSLLDKIPSKNTQGDLEAIEHEFDSITTKNTKMEKIISSHNTFLKADILKKLMFGSAILNENTINQLSELEVNLAEAKIGLIVIDITDPSAFLTDNSENDMAVIRMALKNVVCDLFEDKKGFITFDCSERKIAVILPADSINTTEYVSYVRKNFSTISGTFKEEFGITLFAGVSTLHSESSKFAECFNESMAVLDYSIIRNNDSIIFYDELETTSALGKIKYYYSQDSENKLINMLTNGNFDEAMVIVYEILDKNMRYIISSPDIKRCIYYSYIATFIKASEILDIDRYTEEYVEISAEIPNIMQKNLIELVDDIKKKYEYLSDYSLNSKKPSGVNLADKIKQYIEANYSDSSLCVSMIADHFSYTRQHVSLQFKNATDIKLIDYILLVRIEKAKKLLLDKSLTISDIAEKVGYSDDSSFSKSFKKYEAITPGQYRKTHLN